MKLHRFYISDYNSKELPNQYTLGNLEGYQFLVHSEDSGSRVFNLDNSYPDNQTDIVLCNSEFNLSITLEDLLSEDLNFDIYIIK